VFKPFDFGLHAGNAVEAAREKQLKSHDFPALYEQNAKICNYSSLFVMGGPFSLYQKKRRN
jgi:hypothetical protein